MTDNRSTPLSDTGLERLTEWRRASQMLDWLGFTFTEDEGELTYGLRFTEQHIGNALARMLHGGVVSTFLQSCARAELIARHDLDVAPSTVSVHCDFLRPARALDMQATARIVHAGRRMAFVEVTGWQQDPAKPVGRVQTALRLHRPD